MPPPSPARESPRASPALGRVHDHRRSEDQRYALAGCLLIAVAALLAGRRDQLGIVRWGGDGRRPVARQLNEVLPRFAVNEARPHQASATIRLGPVGKEVFRILGEAGYISTTGPVRAHCRVAEN